MCLSIPMRLIEKDSWRGTAEIDGVRREISLMLLGEDCAVGDYVLVHAGYALTRVDPAEAERSIALLRKVADEGIVAWEDRP